MTKINVKVLTEDALSSIKNNIDLFTKNVQEKDDNTWINKMIPCKLFIEKTYSFNDFELQVNEKSENREIDFLNGKQLFENLHHLPRYILTDVKFWLWLILDKFYKETKSFIQIKSSTTIKNMWLDYMPRRRALFFGVLSRLYFRFELTEINGDYELTKWIYDSPERYRNLGWRSTLSNNKNIVLGTLKGCKKAYDETHKEVVSLYTDIAKFLTSLGSAICLDAYTVDELAEITYKQVKKLLGDIDESK